MRTISLGLKANKRKGYYVIVDDEDYDWLMQWKWHAHTTPTNNTFYAIANTKKIKGYSRRVIRMHRSIMGITDKNVFIDHIDGNGLNNQRSNLRLCNKFESIWNRGERIDNKADCRGVNWNKGEGKWCVRIQKNNKRIHVGYYNKLEDAIVARTRKEKELYGAFSKFN